MDAASTAKSGTGHETICMITQWPCVDQTPQHSFLFGNIFSVICWFCDKIDFIELQPLNFQDSVVLSKLWVRVLEALLEEKVKDIYRVSQIPFFLSEYAEQL